MSITKYLIALLAAALMMSAAPAQDGKGEASILDKAINIPSVNAWNIWGKVFQKSVKDDTVTGGRAIRVEVPHKGEHPWDAAGAVKFTKPVKKGDVLLAAIWARAEKPAPGKTTATITAIGIQLAKAPYTGLFSEPADVGSQWAMYYASGVADRDYAADEINLSVQLAGDEQIIDLGPVFVLNMGPDYPLSKLPHNKLAPAPAPKPAAAPQAAGPEARFAADLTKLRAGLPTKGVLLADPDSAIYAYGPDQTSQQIIASEVPGGKAMRVVLNKKGNNPWDDGASMTLTGDIHKGDALLIAVHMRAVDASGPTASVTNMGLHLASSPWTDIATTAVMLPKGKWQTVYIRAIAEADYPAGSYNMLFQLGADKQTIDIGPVFVLNLGQGVVLSALPTSGIH